MKRNELRMASLTLLVLLGACEKAPPPVAEVQLATDQIRLPYPGFDELQMTWRLLEPLGETLGEPQAFVHLLDGDGDVVRTFDQILPFDWQPGESRSLEIMAYQSALAPPLAAGTYGLSVGLYDLSGKRWPLRTTGREVDDHEYEIAEVEVDGDAAEVPMFYFSSGWQPLEAGTDSQILGRRWLSGEGTIRMAEIPGEGIVWLSFRVPSPDPAVEELSLAEGEEEATVRISSTCSDVTLSETGFGRSEIRLPVEAAEGGELPAECEILLQPNFYLVELNSLARRSLTLEVLAWSR